jgi:hypothetical protein
MNRAERRIIAARIRRRLDRVFEKSEWMDASSYRMLRCNEGKKYNWYRGPYFERDWYVMGRLARLSREAARLDTEYQCWLNGDFG